MTVSGFFYDDDAHAQRLINIGMAYAYHHLEMDSIAAESARIIYEFERGVHSGAHLVETAGRAQIGGALKAPADARDGRGADLMRHSAVNERSAALEAPVRLPVHRLLESFSMASISVCTLAALPAPAL